MSRLGENLLKAPIGSGHLRSFTGVRVVKEDPERFALQTPTNPQQLDVLLLLLL